MKRASSAFRQSALLEMGLAPRWVRRAPIAAVAEDAMDAATFEEGTAPGPVLGDGTKALEALGATRAAAPQRDQLIARLDWAGLEQEALGCAACGLSRSRKQAVFGVGALRPQWLLVGEAPGAEEDERGEPFVGEAGRLLDNMLRALGLARGREVYIANVLKCRPPRNRNPEPEEVARCAPFLLRQIELLAPRIIVALGKFAAETLLGTQASVGSLRGRVHRVHIGAASWPVVVTYHPAYLLRNLPEKRKSWADLCLAVKVLGETESAGPQ
jgi:DNA polymerase